MSDVSGGSAVVLAVGRAVGCVGTGGASVVVAGTGADAGVVTPAAPDGAPAASRSAPVGPASGALRMAARAAPDRTRPLAASMPAAAAVLGAAARRRRPIPLTQPLAAASSRRPSDILRRAMSSGQSRSARTSRNGHRSVDRSVAVRSWIHGWSGVAMTAPPVAARSEARNGSFAPSSRYSAAVGATSPTGNGRSKDASASPKVAHIGRWDGRYRTMRRSREPPAARAAS